MPKGCGVMTLTISKDQPKCKCCKHQGGKLSLQALDTKKRKKRASRPTSSCNSLEYLLYVGGLHFLKVHKTSWYGLDLTPSSQGPKKCGRVKVPTMTVVDSPESKDKASSKSNLNQRRKPSNKAEWSSLSEDSTTPKVGLEVPENFCSYTVQDRSIILQSPKREKPLTLGESNDGLEDAKVIDLADPGEEPRSVWIAIDLSLDK